MPAYMLALYRTYASTILVEFTTKESARAFAAKYYYMSRGRGGEYAKFLLEGETYLGGTEYVQVWLYNKAEVVANPSYLGSGGTILVDEEEALALGETREPHDYPVGESDAIWTRNTKTHADLDAELEAYFAAADMISVD